MLVTGSSSSWTNPISGRKPHFYHFQCNRKFFLHVKTDFIFSFVFWNTKAWTIAEFAPLGPLGCAPELKKFTSVALGIAKNRRLGVWYSRETTPEPGNRFRLRLRLRCVRACVRSCVRVAILQWLGVAGWSLSGGPSVRPSVRLPRSRGVFFAFGLGLCEDVQLSLTSVSVFRSRWWSLLGSGFLLSGCVLRLADPPASFRPASFFHFIWPHLAKQKKNKSKTDSTQKQNRSKTEAIQKQNRTTETKGTQKRNRRKTEAKQKQDK